MIINDFDFGML